ncbi:hypothetical protein HKX48_000905 [Thoreauomyces humboldtii]|nr:hypothetical protein HKX48_000905 [Thoreauomyces humboldtii]
MGGGRQHINNRFGSADLAPLVNVAKAYRAHVARKDSTQHDTPSGFLGSDPMPTSPFPPRGTARTAESTRDATRKPQQPPCTKSLQVPLQFIHATQQSMASELDALSRPTVRRRVRTADWQREILMEAFGDGDKMPDLATRADIATRLGWTGRAVQVWFQNRRAKNRVKSAAQEDDGGGKTSTAGPDQRPNSLQNQTGFSHHGRQNITFPHIMPEDRQPKPVAKQPQSSTRPSVSSAGLDGTKHVKFTDQLRQAKSMAALNLSRSYVQVEEPISAEKAFTLHSTYASLQNSVNDISFTRDRFAFLATARERTADRGVAPVEALLDMSTVYKDSRPSAFDEHGIRSDPLVDTDMSTSPVLQPSRYGIPVHAKMNAPDLRHASSWDSTSVDASLAALSFPLQDSFPPTEFDLETLLDASPTSVPVGYLPVTDLTASATAYEPWTSTQMEQPSPQYGQSAPGSPMMTDQFVPRANSPSLTDGFSPYALSTLLQHPQQPTYLQSLAPIHPLHPQQMWDSPPTQQNMKHLDVQQQQQRPHNPFLAPSELLSESLKYQGVDTTTTYSNHALQQMLIQQNQELQLQLLQMKQESQYRSHHHDVTPHQQQHNHRLQQLPLSHQTNLMTPQYAAPQRALGNLGFEVPEYGYAGGGGMW